MNERNMLHVGLDVGSTTIKCVVLDEREQLSLIHISKKRCLRCASVSRTDARARWRRLDASLT